MLQPKYTPEYMTLRHTSVKGKCLVFERRRVRLQRALHFSVKHDFISLSIRADGVSLLCFVCSTRNNQTLCGSTYGRYEVTDYFILAFCGHPPTTPGNLQSLFKNG